MTKEPEEIDQEYLSQNVTPYEEGQICYRMNLDPDNACPYGIADKDRYSFFMGYFDLELERFGVGSRRSLPKSFLTNRISGKIIK